MNIAIGVHPVSTRNLVLVDNDYLSGGLFREKCVNKGETGSTSSNDKIVCDDHDIVVFSVVKKK